MEQQPVRPGFLGEAEQAIAEASENIERELIKNDPNSSSQNSWFDCFNTNASCVIGYYELAQVRQRQSIPSDKAEIWQGHIQQLKDELKRRRDEAGNNRVEVDEDGKVQLMNLLDIFREPDPQE